MDVIESLAAKQAITEIIYRYCRAIDRMDLELLLSVWHPDGTIGIEDANGIRQPKPVKAHFEQAWRGVSKYSGHSHQVTNIIIELSGDSAASECAMFTVSQENRPDGRIRQDLYWGRYLDRWSLRDGVWAIDHRERILDCTAPYEFEATMVGSEQSLSGLRNSNDPSYQYIGGINPQS